MISFGCFGLNVGGAVPSASARAPAVQASALSIAELKQQGEAVILRRQTMQAALSKEEAGPDEGYAPTTRTAWKSVSAFEKGFVYSPNKPMSANFAANMGDCASFKLGDGSVPKPRIVPAKPVSQFSSFLNDAPAPHSRSTPRDWQSGAVALAEAKATAQA